MKKQVSAYVMTRIKRCKNDFIIQTFRCGGKGGQNQNKRDTGVRLIDKATGLRAEGREHRTQLENRKSAFLKLIDLLICHYTTEEIKLKADFRNNSLIRSYNKHDNRVTDERTGCDYDLKAVLNGKLEALVKDMILDEFSEQMGNPQTTDEINSPN